MDKPLVRHKEGIGCALPAPAWETYGLFVVNGQEGESSARKQ